MKTWGLTEKQVVDVVGGLGLAFGQSEPHREGAAQRFSVRPIASDSRYARRSFPSIYSPTPRRGPWLCWHGWVALIGALFDAGATRVDTALGSWESHSEFTWTLPRLAQRNVGSIMYPVALKDGNICDCVETQNWNAACDYDRIARSALFAVFSPHNPYKCENDGP